MIQTPLIAFALLVAQADGASLELFAKEAWYKDAQGPEKEFVGILKKTERGKGVVGIGRFNPFRLEMDAGQVREVYVGGKPKLLDPYVGKKIKLVGKAVDLEVVGRVHKEIWPASLVVLAGGKKTGAKNMEPKIHARTSAAGIRTSAVVKSAEQLGKLLKTDPDRASANLARLLKVDAIDWDKQMVVVIYGGERPTGGYSVEVQSLKVKDGKLVVNWKLNRPGPMDIVTQAFTYPSLTILVDRLDGSVEYEPKAP